MDPILILGSAAAVAAAGLGVHALCIEPARVEVTRQELPVTQLPPVWEGARMVHLTDLHYGDPRSASLFQWMVETVNDLAPDLIVITGDFVLNRAVQAVWAAQYLAQLRARHGVVAVLGDHDFVRRRKKVKKGVAEVLQAAEVQLLRNSAIQLPGGLRVAGIDPTTRKVQAGDIDAALAALAGPPHVFLAHGPDIIADAAHRGIPLVLCGHTHGGQVVLPFYGPPVTHTRVSRKFASGWSSFGETRMYTCRGLASHLSLRFLCRPEIAVFTLTRAPVGTKAERVDSAGAVDTTAGASRRG